MTKTGINLGNTTLTDKLCCWPVNYVCCLPGVDGSLPAISESMDEHDFMANKE